MYPSDLKIAEKNFSFSPVLFPAPQSSGHEIVAVTEFLDRDILYSAYLQGIFPWYNQDQGEPVAWWSLDPRFVLFPEELHIPARLARFLRHTPYSYTIDKAFKQVIENCAKIKREGQNGSWIGSQMQEAYCDLHSIGVAHSIEAWKNNQLAGGFYGVQIGSVFFGESMFTLMPNSAKSAFVLFVQAFKECGGGLIDSQIYTDNIARFGGKNISRTAFLHLEKQLLKRELITPLQRHPTFNNQFDTLP
ncbi:MAG: leucyl/phenylalanyl-tRNA--protein transferase [Spirochaetaceae bacterium]|nr:leucyl/phenylalanyl-tRNA--protein transferase [Spirochaetaceae bacterium]